MENVFDEAVCIEDGDSPTGRVQDIRRQWAIHEDEALALKLQDEEIHLHYSGNRTRNAIVREDGPRAREEQRREEQQALEERLHQLSLLQKQAEDDAKVAHKLAKKYEAQAANDTSNGDDSIMSIPLPPKIGHAKEALSLLGASCMPSTSAAAIANQQVEKKYEELRVSQERQDEELARKVQDELEQLEKDKQIAIEAQDRELAKMLYEKDKARIRRAKERARLKAEAAASLNKGGSDNYSTGNSSDTASEMTQTPTRRTPDTDGIGFAPVPPKVPEKTKDGFLGFKANPKKLPAQPQPSIPGGPLFGPAHRDNRPLPEDPTPPYMPLKGFNRSGFSPRRPH